MSELPDVPTIAETLPGFEMVGWAGLMLPIKTPRDIVQTVHKAALSVLNKPDMRKRLSDQGYVVVSGQPDEMEKLPQG